MYGNKNYAILTASAKMRRIVATWERYGRVAVAELEPGVSSDDVRTISDRARGVRRIVATWERCHIGCTTRCAFERAYAEAESMVEDLERAASLAAILGMVTRREIMV